MIEELCLLSIQKNDNKFYLKILDEDLLELYSF